MTSSSVSAGPAGSRSSASSSVAAEYDRWFDSPWGRYAFGVEASAVLAVAGELHGRTVLDVGCGSGRFAAALETAGARVTGLDADPTMLQLAERRVSGGVLLGEAGELPFPDGTFDLAFAITVLEFTADPGRVIDELVRVVRPRGRVVIASLNRHSPWGVAHRRRLLEPPWDRGRLLGRTELRRLGARYGEPRLTGVLLAPGRFPGLRRIGPILERLSPAVPALGAFQVLAVERR